MNSVRLAALLLLLIAAPVFATPPPGADPTSPVGRWYQSLKDPSGMSCCGQGDCRAVRADMREGHWWVWIKPDDASPVQVPDGIVRMRDDNPTGHSILCASPVQPETIMYCFIPLEAV